MSRVTKTSVPAFVTLSFCFLSQLATFAQPADIYPTSDPQNGG